MFFQVKSLQCHLQSICKTLKEVGQGHTIQVTPDLDSKQYILIFT